MDRPPNDAFPQMALVFAGDMGDTWRKTEHPGDIGFLKSETGHKTASAETGLTTGPFGLGNSHDPYCTISPLCWLLGRSPLSRARCLSMVSTYVLTTQVEI